MAQDTVSLYSERPDTCTTSRLSSAAEVTIAGSGKLLSIIRQWVASTTSCGQHKRGEGRSRKRVWRSMKWNKEMLSHIRPTTRTTPKKTFLFLLWMNTSNWSIPLNGHGAAGLSCACTTTVWLAVVSSGVNTHQQTWLPSLFIRPSCLPTSLKERCKSSSGGPTNSKCITATYWAGVCASLLPEIKQLITLIFACDELIKLTFLSHSFKKRRMNNNDLIRMWFPDCVTKWPLSAVMKH